MSALCTPRAHREAPRPQGRDPTVSEVSAATLAQLIGAFAPQEEEKPEPA